MRSLQPRTIDRAFTLLATPQIVGHSLRIQEISIKRERGVRRFLKINKIPASSTLVSTFPHALEKCVVRTCELATSIMGGTCLPDYLPAVAGAWCFYNRTYSAFVHPLWTDMELKIAWQYHTHISRFTPHHPSVSLGGWGRLDGNEPMMECSAPGGSFPIRHRAVVLVSGGWNW